jgi:hypothetical protein
MSGKMRLMFMRIIVVAVILMLCIGSGFTQTTPDKSRRENLDLQERCGTQAQKVFKQWQAENEAEGKRWKLPSNMQTVSADYQSHYNAPLNRCFMTVLDTMSNGSTSKWLIDAFESRQYAFYFWIPDPKGVKQYWEMRPVSCELTPSVREKRFCNSEDEYDEYVATYMEQ